MPKSVDSIGGAIIAIIILLSLRGILILIQGGLQWLTGWLYLKGGPKKEQPANDKDHGNPASQ